jgi:hypothetical protein
MWLVLAHLRHTYDLEAHIGVRLFIQVMQESIEIRILIIINLDQ